MKVFWMAVEKMKEKATTMDENEIHALLTSTCTSAAAVNCVQLSTSSLGDAEQRFHSSSACAMGTKMHQVWNMASVRWQQKL